MGPSSTSSARVRFAVRAALISDGLELLVALGMLLAAQMRQSRVRRHLDVIDAIVNGDRALQHRAAEGYIAFARNRIGGDIHFGHDLSRGVGDNAFHRDTSPEVQIRGRNLRGQAFRDQAHARWPASRP